VVASCGTAVTACVVALVKDFNYNRIHKITYLMLIYIIMAVITFRTINKIFFYAEN
jgi:hypothetical protein